MAFYGLLSQKCLIRFAMYFAMSCSFVILLSIEAKAAPTVTLALPDPMEFVQQVEAKAFEHLGQIITILVSLIGVKWLIEVLKGSS